MVIFRIRKDIVRLHMVTVMLRMDIRIMRMRKLGYAGRITASVWRHLSFEKINMFENMNIQCTLNWTQ